MHVLTYTYVCVYICIYTPDFTREEDYKYLSMQHNLYIYNDEGKRILKEKKDNYSFLAKDFFRGKIQTTLQSENYSY